MQKAVVRAVEALIHRKDGKGGVIWFTQGSGKSLLALFYVMALRDHPEFQNPTTVLVADRNDLDGQLFEAFADSRWSLRATPEQANSREELRSLLSAVRAGGIFLTINKFAPENGQTRIPVLCERSNVVVIADEAHRTSTASAPISTPALRGSPYLSSTDKFRPPSGRRLPPRPLRGPMSRRRHLCP